MQVQTTVAAPSLPLQVLLFRHRLDLESATFEDSIVRAFQGGKEAGGYLATGEDLGIQLEVYSGRPLSSVQENLAGACHTLVIVIGDDHLRDAGSDLWEWLDECWARIAASNGQHRMLAVPVTERHGQAFVSRQALESLQLLQVHTLGEPAARPARLALLALHQARLLLANVLQRGVALPGYLRLFISHAKIDGLPLAHALKHEIATMSWLEKFYDADDLPAGSDWQKGLEDGVGSSLLVMLRTDAYDSRPWCQREVLWAEEYAVPSVLVDARTVLGAAGGRLPFETAPWVRIPDGNLFRILFAAIREGLRFLLFARRVVAMKSRGDVPTSGTLVVFSSQPSMAALVRASSALASKGASTNAMIIYPDPPMRAGLYEAALAVVREYSPGTHLVTPQTIAASGDRA